jgi:hypothetical protein
MPASAYGQYKHLLRFSALPLNSAPLPNYYHRAAQQADREVVYEKDMQQKDAAVSDWASTLTALPLMMHRCLLGNPSVLL